MFRWHNSRIDGAVAVVFVLTYMLLRATHRTVYEYLASVGESHNEVRLEPLSDHTQTCRSFKLITSPAAKVFAYDDFGGRVHHFTIRKPHNTLEITAEALVETRVQNPFSGLNLLEADGDFYRSDAMRQAMIEYLTPSPYVPEHPAAREIAERMVRPDQSTASYLLDLNRYLHDILVYDPSATNVHSTLDEVIAGQAGVCQDFSHLMIACCRSRGIPARYVSGYLFAHRGDGLRGEQATHAWLECLLPDGRWLAVDPTNNLLANDRYIRVHIGRDYSDVSPTRGIYVGPRTKTLKVSVFIDDMNRVEVAA